MGVAWRPSLGQYDRIAVGGCDGAASRWRQQR